MLKFQSYLSLSIFIIIFASFTGCGYHFKDQGEPQGIRLTSIAIPLITSTSTVKGFEAGFTEMIRNEFISHAKIPILPKEEAQAVLTGHIYEIRREPVSFNREPYTLDGHQSSYETTNAAFLKIKLDIRLVDRPTDKTIWHEKAMEEKVRYGIGTDPIANQYNHQQALLKIAKALAKQVYLKTMERF